MKNNIRLLRGNEAMRGLQVVYVAEGYTAQETALFNAQADKLAAGLLKCGPIAAFADRINCWAVMVPSQVSGISDGLKTVKQTPFHAQLNYGGVARVLGMATDRYVRAAVAEHFPSGQELLIVVCCNTTAYGGSGGGVIMVTRHADAVKIQNHEFGHTFGELGDEYTTEIPYWPRFARRNLSLTPDPKLVPWSDMVGQPDGLGGVIGVYEGGGYHKKGIWRPTKKGCGMAALGKPFCAVCTRAIAARLISL